MSLQYSELVCQVTLCCALCFIFSGSFLSVGKCIWRFFKIEMADINEQLVWVKFCFCLGKTAAETVTIYREACKDKAMGKTKVYKWFSHFKRGGMC